MKIILLIISLIPTTIFAEGISYDCKKENNINDCKMYATSNFEVSAIEYEISGNVLEFTPISPWLGDYENNKILLYTDEYQKGQFEIGHIKYKGKIKEKRLSYGNNEFKEVEIITKKEKNYYILLIILIILIGLLLIKRRKRK